MESFRWDIIACVLFWGVLLMQSYLAMTSDLLFSSYFSFAKDLLWKTVGQVVRPEFEKRTLHLASCAVDIVEKVVGDIVPEKAERFYDNWGRIVKQLLNPILPNGASRFCSFERNVIVFPCTREHANQANRILSYPADFNNRFDKNSFELANRGFYFEDAQLVCFSCQRTWSVPDMLARDQAQWHHDGCNHYKTLTDPSQGVNYAQALFVNQDRLEEKNPISPPNCTASAMGSGARSDVLGTPRRDFSERVRPSDEMSDDVPQTDGSELPETTRGNSPREYIILPTAKIVVLLNTANSSQKSV